MAQNVCHLLERTAAIEYPARTVRMIVPQQLMASGAEEFDAFIRGEIARWGPVVKAAGLKTE